LIYFTSNTNKGYLNQIADCLIEDGNNVIYYGNKLNNNYNNKLKSFETPNNNFDGKFGLRFYISIIIKALYHFCWLKILFLYYVIYLKLYQLSCVIVPGDRDLGRINAIMKASHFCKIPVVAIPIAKSGPIDETLYFRRNNKYYMLPHKKFLTSRLEEQAVKDSVTSMLYLNFGLAYSLALYFSGMLPKYTWGRTGGGGSSFCLLDSNNTFNDYMDEFINKKKYIVTGTLEHDIIYKNIPKKKSSKKIAVVNLCNWLESKVYSAKTTKKKHIQFLDLCERISALNYKVLISLHPTMLYDNYKWIEDEYGFEISSQRLSYILGSADLYLVQGYSSTCDWAISLNLPLFVHNDQKMPNTLENTKFTIHVSYLESDLINNVIKMEKNKDRLDKDTISLIDGCAEERIKRNLVKIIESKDMGYPYYK